MITINKAVVTRIPPEQIRAGLDALATDAGNAGDEPAAARLRDLAVRLAADRDLQVSVILYEDGRAELEVLHAGPPHYTAATIDCAKFAQPEQEGWVVSLTGDGALQDAADLIRGTLAEASEGASEGAREPKGHDGWVSPRSAASASDRSRAKGT
jgi:hypothetical protein